MTTREIHRSKLNTHFSLEQYDLLMKCSASQDMTEWNEWRKRNPKIPVRFRNADIKNAYLRGADLHKADFRGANLRGLDLSGAKRGNTGRLWANLSGADFREADLCGTDLRGANLSGADFSRAYLYYTNLSWTKLRGANFSGTDLWAFLYRADLTAVDLDLANRRLSDFTKTGCKYTKMKNAAVPPATDIYTADSEIQLVLINNLQTTTRNLGDDSTPDFSKMYFAKDAGYRACNAFYPKHTADIGAYASLRG
ncbi:pentapeptide repeat-containing protein [Desulfogranum japonicum]|uniref:pentapeptide repeat-containing protein n=1 Tax=Desulfogranum japonicum TaxID=231447 RepID=UPI000687C692|nr:pentapeptide repeat-containing protein [Desulfogranum japonicum]